MSFTIPTTCPVCGANTRIEKKDSTEVLVCPNPYCSAKIEGKILHFLDKNGLDIESISKATVKDLIQLGWLKRMADVFTLKSHRDEWIGLKGYGETSVDKILEAIPTSIELWKVIASAGIPNVEKQTAILISENFTDWTDFRNAVDARYDFTKLNGIGTVTARDILDFDYAEIDEVMNYLTIKAPVVGGKLANKSFCITGTLSMKRDDFVKLIEAHGGKFASVGKSLDYLICNDKNSTSGKSGKAKALGIPVITEEEFMAMLS